VHASFDSPAVSGIERCAASDRCVAFNEDGILRRYGVLDVQGTSSSFPDVQAHIVDAPSVGNCRPEATGPESILLAGVMDSGLARFARAPE
jgi:hypothetical protein